MNLHADNPVVDALHDASAAADRLATINVDILAAYANGRRPVLIIAAAPPFVHGVQKRRNPNARGGFDRVMAASYHGVQLEWIETEPAPVREVARG